MNPLYTPFKNIFNGLLTFTSFSLFAQPLEFLNINNVNAGIGVGGNLFSLVDSQDYIYWHLLEVPKGSGKRSVYTASLWMSGIDAQGNTHCAAQRYAQGGHDFYDGPITAIYDSYYDTFYSRVFKVKKAEIDAYRSLRFPISVFSTYLVPASVLYWPAKGNPFIPMKYHIEISSALAPFMDKDQDGIYNPLTGDYPAICGDEAIFFVFNDAKGPHEETGQPLLYRLGFEIRGLAYVFYDSTLSPSKTAINNTVFVSYEIENKYHLDYTDFYIALFEDPDLGCFNNDRIGCDTLRDLFFVYNGSTPDLNCQNEIGYNPYEVSQGALILNREMSAFGYFTNGAIFSQQDPGSCGQYRNYMQGFWNDGSPFMNNTGYNNSYITKFMFPGDLNDPNQWSEMQISSVLQPADRRMYGSIGPMDFKQGEVKHFDFAFIVSYDSTATMISIVDTLKRDADIIQQFYDQQITACRNQIFSGLNDMKAEELGVRIYPNPGSDLITIESLEQMEELELMDMQGRAVLQKTSGEKKTSIDVSIYSKGAYLLKISANGKTAFRKLMIQ